MGDTMPFLFLAGIGRFCIDVEFMNGAPPSYITKISWAFFCPLCLGVRFLTCTKPHFCEGFVSIFCT